MRNAKALIWICVLAWAAVVAAAVGAISQAHESSSSYRHDIRVTGSAGMVKTTIEALDLLRASAPDDYEYVCRFANRIEESTRSCADTSSSRIFLAKRTFNASTQWLAAALVHEARHIELSLQRPGYGGQAEELDCMRLQLRTLRRVHGSANEVFWLQSQDGTHFDLKRDGVFDERDTSLQNW